MTDMTMTCAELDLRLADYLSDALDTPVRAAVERHLATCARCAGVVAVLDERSARAAALPVLAPSRDLWSGIAARIEPRVLPLAGRPAPALVSRRRRAVRLAAAAAVLVAATALTTRWVMLHRTAPAQQEARHNGSDPAPNLKSARDAALIRTYDSEIAQLDSAVRLRRSDLDSNTVKVIEKNLRVIDKAIAESRAALVEDPRSRFLNDQLTRVLDQKVGLLRTAALLPART